VGFSFDSYYEPDDYCTIEDMIDMIDGADPEEHGFSGYAARYVSGTVVERIIQLAQAVMTGRGADVLRDRAYRVIEALAADLEVSAVEWLTRFSLRPVRPGGRLRLALDVLDLARAGADGTPAEFATAWRRVFVDRGGPGLRLGPGASDPAAATAVL